MERELKLADGTRLGGCWVAHDAGSMWIYCDGMTMKEGAEIFLNHEKTARMVYIVGEGVQETFDGYTGCVMLNLAMDSLRIQMIRGADA